MAKFLLVVTILTLTTLAIALLSLLFKPFPVLFKPFPVLRKTYCFWAAFSFLNFSYLTFLLFPPLLLIDPQPVLKFLDFLLIPVGVSISVVLGVWVVIIKTVSYTRMSLNPGTWTPYALNLLFLLVFISVADMYKNYLISTALKGRIHDCLHVASFFESLRNAGQDFQFNPHAFFRENGRNFYWSYSEMAFFKGNDDLDRNFLCPGR